MMLTPLFVIGLMIFFAGALLFFFGLYGRGAVSAEGAVVLIGPFPIVLSRRAGGLFTALVLASVLFAMVIALLALVGR